MNKMFAIIPAAFIFAGILVVAAFNITGSAAATKSCGGSCTKTNACGLAECTASTTGTCNCQKTQNSSCPCGCGGTCGWTCSSEECTCSK